MRYDRDWLKGISDTRDLIRCAPIKEVPIEHRALIAEQFDLNVKLFEHDLAHGLDTLKSQAAIADLAYLALDLVVEQDKRRMAAAAVPTNGQ